MADQIPLRVRVSPENYQRAQQAAEALGVSMATYIDRLMSLDELDERGRPVWWTGPCPRDQEVMAFGANEIQEAPLKSA